MMSASDSLGCPLIVMAKAPLPGLSKTRLIPVLGEQATRQLAERLLVHSLDLACTASPPVLEVCCTPTTDNPLFANINHPLVRLTTQIEGDLGARMSAAFASRLPDSRGVLMIGTDAPGLTLEMLREAEAALLSHDAVFIPALDGGYVLIGMSQMHEVLFRDMPWSRPDLMERTREVLIAHGLSWHELQPVADIDDAGDLRFLPAQW